MDRQERWDRDYMALARFWAERKSKDPSTKVGAVIVSPQNEIASMGYNGFPKGVDDSQERYADRETKYQYVVHAEENAVVFSKGQTLGSTIYIWPLFPCSNCAKLIIQSGIKRVVSPSITEGRWNESHKVACIMFDEADVELTVLRDV